MPSTELHRPRPARRPCGGAAARGRGGAFAALVDTYSPALLRVAMTHVRTARVAEEVVQETWLGVIRGIDRFEGRSSLKSWIFTILRNTAINARRARASHRAVLSLSPRRRTTARSWTRIASCPPITRASRVTGRSARRRGRCPRRVSGRRDPRGHRRRDSRAAARPSGRSSRCATSRAGRRDEVCEALEVSEGNQRVLLHRARTKVRAALETYFGAVEPTRARGRVASPDGCAVTANRPPGLPRTHSPDREDRRRRCLTP